MKAKISDLPFRHVARSADPTIKVWTARPSAHKIQPGIMSTAFSEPALRPVKWQRGITPERGRLASTDK